jgi:hypothetical protein
MCAAESTSLTQKQAVPPTQNKPVPKWLKMKQMNKSSAGKTEKPIAKPSSAQKPNQPTRNEKRARWAKKAKPVAKPAVKRGPTKEYLCACHNEPAHKPKAGAKVSVQDPESRKTKETSLGLGKWRCVTTGKACKVTPRTVKPKTEGTIGSSCPDVIYPGKLQTPVLAEAPVAPTQS